MKKIFIILSAILSIGTSQAAPELKGKIKLSIQEGTIDADFQLNNIPRIKDYLILLNAGFNIQYFRNSEDSYNFAYRKEYNSHYSYESFGYYFPDNTGKAKFLPANLQFKYTGKFPVVNGLTKASDTGDWKGNIAFNGKTIRADGLQTAWYPILYDLKKDKKYESVSYDIEVICDDCKSIHVNGSNPVYSQSAKFKRVNPVQLTLFAGDYKIDKYKGNYYLNTGLSNERMNQFGALTASFIAYYERKLPIPYGEDIVYINTTPITKNNAWLFVSFPSIFNISHDGVEDLFDENKSEWFKTFIAHEIAHYYFGTFKKFNSELGDALSESFSEYLSLKLTENIISDKIFNDNIKKKVKSLKDKEILPIKKIGKPSDYRDRNLYVYNYLPIVWIELEKEIGEEKMWQWINLLLTTDTNKTNYTFLINTLAEVVKNKEQLLNIELRYFKSNDFLETNK